MEFLFIISHDGAFRPDEALLSGIRSWIEAAEARGVRIGGKPLEPASAAVTVRLRGGEERIEHAPFSSSEEQMCAYELVRCGGIDEAVALAKTHPMARAATIEVRPVWGAMQV
ncbi:MAG: YciI family protein [Mesorhizobium sp.]|nr:YciI family protein [Mesorhizobium sp.]